MLVIQWHWPVPDGFFCVCYRENWDGEVEVGPGPERGGDSGGFPPDVGQLLLTVWTHPHTQRRVGSVIWSKSVLKDKNNTY